MKVLLGLICLVVLVPALGISQTVLFFDDFEGAMDDQWVTPDGGWVVEDGHIWVTTSCGFDPCNPNLYAGGPDQLSYVVSFDFMVTQAFTNNGTGIRCMVAMTNPIEPGEGQTSGYSLGFGYSADGSPGNANCQIQKLDESNMTEIGYASGPEFWVEPGVLYRAKMGRIGSELVIKKWTVGDPEPNWMLSATDEIYQSGYWLLAYWNQVGWIDNVLVEGYGVVPTEAETWGGMKALYR